MTLPADERAAFEAWAAREYGWAFPINQDEVSEFVWATYFYAWASWQARAAHRPVEPKEGV